MSWERVGDRKIVGKIEEGARPAVDPVLTACLFVISFYLLK